MLIDHQVKLWDVSISLKTLLVFCTIPLTLIMSIGLTGFKAEHPFFKLQIVQSPVISQKSTAGSVLLTSSSFSDLNISITIYVVREPYNTKRMLAVILCIRKSSLHVFCFLFFLFTKTNRGMSLSVSKLALASFSSTVRCSHIAPSTYQPLTLTITPHLCFDHLRVHIQCWAVFSVNVS